ncbi:hypothetical protein M1116_03915 [Patescibacteria group bacterium]|nr:hypothetical protein [Patescibacteria group bacterium]
MKKVKITFGYLYLPLIFIATGLILNYFDNQLKIPFIRGFVNSNLLNPLITVLVGSIAYVLYKKQKDDYKTDAANVILLEIENAEKMLKKASESLAIGTTKLHIVPEKNFVMQTESWSKYRYLFVRDFTQTEWDAVSDFYNKCHLFDQAIMDNDSYLEKDMDLIRENAHKYIAKFISNSAIELASANNEDTNMKQQKIEKIMKSLKEVRIRFNELYIDSEDKFLYSPRKAQNDAIFYIENLNSDLSLTTVGKKLRELAGL